MNKKFISGIIVLILVIAGVYLYNNQSSYKLHESGLKYKLFIENKKEKQVQLGDIVALKFILKDESGKDIEESALFRTQMKEPSHDGGSIEDALSLMHLGDSGVFFINAKGYFLSSKKTQVPEQIDPESFLEVHIKVANIISVDEFEQERQTNKIFGEREEEQVLKKYIERANITIEPEISGLYFIEETVGNGKRPTPGKKVKVHYMGYFVDGQVFDSSYERNKPFLFTLGVGEVIQGWDEGISKMKVGGKAKLIIPSYLAYANDQVGPIPPFATLIFEIELLAAQ